ncbi:fatty acyl-AMP ligase [Rhizosaccharibacter radicis]|uniref:Fatty acyl-AMP ligase n=1 Tax=Rhizosaccharibacter radicis TaxID=2782605 RepID=A0ABT1VV14_9PROT|nr:fatty acyl-AMP ligase [Acetobacteraceae bacterium KSS12]
MSPMPTASLVPQRLGDFPTLCEALDYAATGANGLLFHSARDDGGTPLFFRTLREDALRLARRLIAIGLRPGDRAGLIADTSADFVRAFFACQYAGVVPAPLPLPAAFGGRASYLDHAGRMIRQARAAILLAPASLAEWFSPEAAALGLRFCGSVGALEALGGGEVAALPAVGEDDLAYLQFSSGSTRQPMGVAVRHSALMANLRGIVAHGLRGTPEDRAVSWLPLYHDMGLVGFLLAPLAAQITVDLLPTQDFARRPQLWLQLISRNRASISYSPSFGYELCVRRNLAPQEFELSSWRIAGIGGDMIRPHVLEEFAGRFAAAGFAASAFLPSYGMAEATLALCFAPLGQGLQQDTLDVDRMEGEQVAVPPRPGARARSFVVCGTPLPGHEAEIRDEEGAVLPDRQVGRIFARGPSLMLGYDGRPAETAEVLSADGWLDTGDLGYRLNDSLVITGRAKDLIIVNGRNIWPQDLEWSVEHLVPEVRAGRVAAFSVDRGGREAVILAAETRPSSEPAERIEAAIAGAVRAQHGVDAEVLLLPVNSLPFTSSGKLSRAGTRQRFLGGAFVLPATTAVAS